MYDKISKWVFRSHKSVTFSNRNLERDTLAYLNTMYTYIYNTKYKGSCSYEENALHGTSYVLRQTAL